MASVVFVVLKTPKKKVGACAPGPGVDLPLMDVEPMADGPVALRLGDDKSSERITVKIYIFQSDLFKSHF
jgi:hypothetical protein